MTASSKENLPRRRFASMLLLLVFVERASSFLPLTSPRILSTATSSSSSKSPFSSSVRSLRSTTNDSKEEQAETTTTSIASKEEEEESSKRTRLYQSLKRLQKDFLPSKAVNLYTSYAGRLWNETNPEARQLVAGNQTIRLVRQLQQVLRSNNENDRDILISVERRKEVMDACDHLLQDAAVVEVNETSVASLKESVSKVMVMQDNDSNGEATAKKKKKPRRSIMFGAIMGAVRMIVMHSIHLCLHASQCFVCL